ncbi:MAG TPA: hypothetical protein VK524_20275 [Polyangiaceae bacterium]|nr:hypothetical protein [Polyangiaceae bacterium]
MSLFSRVLQRSVPELIRAACVLALVGLAFMVYSVLSPGALPVILAMSVGHGIGGLAVTFYIMAVILDARGRPPPDASEK